MARIKNTRVFLNKIREQQREKRLEVEPLKDYALNRLLQGGFIFPDQPMVNNFYLQLPAEITNISDQDLGEYLNAFTQQKNWILTLLASVEVELIDVQAAYDDAYSFEYENCPYNNVSDKKVYASTRKKVRFWKRRLDKTNATLIMADKNLQTVDNVIFLLSREVTRRTGLRENENRNYNVNNIRRK